MSIETSQQYWVVWHYPFTTQNHPSHIKCMPTIFRRAPSVQRIPIVSSLRFLDIGPRKTLTALSVYHAGGTRIFISARSMNHGGRYNVVQERIFLRIRDLRTDNTVDISGSYSSM
uniref:Uncharacterized protein n=1 Tax=Cacopsylla melanoneura TaxID=428564 RepID=A0A8D8ZBS7_9HEMI